MNNMNYSGNPGPGGQMPPHQYIGQPGGQLNRMVMQQGGRMMPNQPMPAQNMMHMQNMRYPPQQGQPGPHGQMGQMGRQEMGGQQYTQQQQNNRVLMNLLVNSMPPDWKQRFEGSLTAQERQKILIDYKEHIGPQAVNSLITQHQRQSRQMQGGPPQMHRQGSFQMNQPNQFPQQPSQGQHEQYQRSQQFIGQQGQSQEQKVGAPTQMGQMQHSPQVVQRPGSVKPVASGVQPSPQFQSQYQQQGGPPSVNAPGTPQQPNQIKNHSPMAASGQMGPSKVQQRPGGPGSVGGPRSMHYAPSPGMAGGPGSVQGPPSQPPTTQPLSVQGQRAGTPNTQQRSGQTPTPHEKEQPEYKATLEELKQLRPQTLVMLERVRLERHHNLEKSLIKVLEIMEGRKEADIKLMQKLLGNVRTSLNNFRPTRSLNDFVNRVCKVPSELESSHLPDKWECLDKFKIKLPEETRDTIKQKLVDEKLKRKRKAPTMSEVKIEADEQGAVYELRSHVSKASKIRVKRPIYEELEKYTYYVDPDFLPITDNTNYVQVVVDFKPKELDKLDYIVPPLRILVPREYPSQPIQLGHLIPFRADAQCPISVRVMEALSKEVDEQVLSSLSQLISVWRRVSVRLLIPNADRNVRKQLGVN